MQSPLLDAITRYAEACDKVTALILVGSQARTAQAADAYSDIDLIMVVKDPEPFVCSDSWLKEIGTVHISFIENTVDGQKERRALFDGAQDVDFVIIHEGAALQALKHGEAAGILSRGYRVLVDKQRLSYPAPGNGPPFTPAEEAGYLNTVHDFWFHTVWTAKKLLRGEVWAAKSCTDGYMKQRLLWMIEQYEHAVRRSAGDTWYAGRFIDRWAGEDILRELQTSFAHYDSADIAAALQATMKLFRRLAIKVSEARGFHYPAHADEYASAWVGKRLTPLLRQAPGKGGAL